jgi:hypothetical protein
MVRAMVFGMGTDGRRWSVPPASNRWATILVSDFATPSDTVSGRCARERGEWYSFRQTALQFGRPVFGTFFGTELGFQTTIDFEGETDLGSSIVWRTFGDPWSLAARYAADVQKLLSRS